MLDRRAVVASLLADRGDLAVVTGLGGTAWDVAAAGDDALDFPSWGAMGGAAMIGLGLAIAQPARPVLVVTGDGEQLMALGAFATIAVQRPANLSVVVIDNERYGETGSQVTHTGRGVDLAAVAAACGITDTRVIVEDAGIAPLRTAIHALTGPFVAIVKVAPDQAPMVLPPRDGALLTQRMRAALGV